MLKKVIVPTLGLDMEGATIQRWLKAEGDKVAKDEPILVVETDKATTEIYAPASGVLRQIIQREGAFVPVTETVALVETAEAGANTGSTSSTREPFASAFNTNTGTGSSSTAEPYATDIRPGGHVNSIAVGDKADDVGAGGPSAPSPLAMPGDRSPIRASPAARRLARELGVDLARVEGTGPGGRIQGEDVQRFTLGQVPASDTKPSTRSAAPMLGSDLPGRLVPLSRKRKLTAERMALSTTVVARLTMDVDVDATEVIRWRARVLPVLQESEGTRVTYNDILVKIVAVALKDHPYLNARWTDEGIYLVEPINIGVAVAVDDGLVVPVIRDADKKTVAEISVEMSRLVAKAREDRLSMADISGGTFTITNLGMFGIDSFTPIVNPPEAAILGVGRIAERGVGVDGQLVLRSMMTLSLSFDHCILDGATAARFLQRVKQLLEEPYLSI